MVTDKQDEAPGPDAVPSSIQQLPVALGEYSALNPAVLAGVSLSHDGADFRVDIVDAAGETFLSLGPYPDDEIVAVWRSLAASSGLPLLTSTPDGGRRELYRQLGRVVFGRKEDPRRLAVLSGRRPRFLVKRKPGRLPGRPVVYREPELAGGRQA